MRSEKWSEAPEIKRALKMEGAGPLFYVEDGKPYAYDGEANTLILGMSGTGKTRGVSIPTVHSYIRNHESAIIVDPKGEIYKYTEGSITKDYDCHVINCKDPEASETVNPLTLAYKNWMRNGRGERHYATEVIEELADNLFHQSNKDPFWDDSAKNLFIGAVYGLFEAGKPSEINLSSIYHMVVQGEEKLNGSNNYLSKFASILERNEDVAMHLKSFVTTASDTKAGIRSTFLNGLSIAAKSKAIRRFISGDDLDIDKIRADRPVLIYIILPDETSIYDRLTGLLVSQLTKHFIRLADRHCDGRLPIRMNIFLEELGNIGNAITDLPHLLSAGRSRNIRVQFVLQSLSQLEDIYGKANSDTILGNADTQIAFRLSHWRSLNELSDKCGKREVERDGCVKESSLITSNQVGAMETRQAIVMISGRVKFTTWLPDFTELYDLPAEKPEEKELDSLSKNRASDDADFFNIKDYVDEKVKEEKEIFEKQRALAGIPDFETWLKTEYKKKRLREMQKEKEGDKKTGKQDFDFDPFDDEGLPFNSIDIDRVIKGIDERIALLEKAEAEEGGKDGDRDHR